MLSLLRDTISDSFLKNIFCNAFIYCDLLNCFLVGDKEFNSGEHNINKAIIHDSTPQCYLVIAFSCFMTEAFRANQWTGFYMITATVLKDSTSVVLLDQ